MNMRLFRKYALDTYAPHAEQTHKRSTGVLKGNILPKYPIENLHAEINFKYCYWCSFFCSNAQSHALQQYALYANCQSNLFLNMLTRGQTLDISSCCKTLLAVKKYF